VKYCKIGYISLKCKYFKELNMVKILITDTGIGIKNNDIEKLNQYVIPDDRDNLNRQGCGLGLSICKTLADMLDLKLEFKSEYGKGTEITIDIPILQIDEIEEESFEDFSINVEQIPNIGNLLFLFVYLKYLAKDSGKLRNDNNIIIYNFENSNNEIDNELNELKESNIIEKKNNIITNYNVNEKNYDSIIEVRNNITNEDNYDSNKLNTQNFSIDYLSPINNFCANENTSLLILSTTNNKTKEENNNSSNKYEKSEIIFKLNHRKILIVEDEVIMNKSIKNLLEKIIETKNLAISVVQCYDGIDLLKEIIDDQKNGNFIDLIIIDENMEYMNGTQALSILIDLELKNKVKMPYIISSTTDILTREKMDLLKIKKVLPKPITRDSMINLLKDLKYFE
jgi:CheY-like chemotaxis protein